MLDILLNPYIAAILVYLLALVGVGVYKSRGVKDSEDFMVAGRTLPWYILVGTLLATWIGNGSLFGGAGLGYRNGFAGAWSSAGAWVGIMFVWVIARRVRQFGKVTIPDIFEARYNSTAGVLATITTIIAYLTIVSYQFNGGGRILSVITDGGITVEAGIIITAVFAITYTALAGMVSVVYTDVVNGALMMGGVLAAIIVVVIAVGGPAEIVAHAEATGKTGFFGNWSQESALIDSAPLIAISFFVPTMLLLMGDANTYQRIFSARDGGSAKKAVLFWVVGVMVLELSIYFLGLTGAVAAAQGIIPELFPGGGPADTAANLSENVIPTIAREAVPLVVGMVLVATMMAIVVSTADSFLLVPATNLTRDVYQRFVTPHVASPRFTVIARIVLVLVGLLFFLVVDGWLWRMGVLLTVGWGVTLLGSDPHRMLRFLVQWALVLAGLFVMSRTGAWWFQVATAGAVVAAMRFVPDDEEARLVFVSRFMVLFLGFIAFLLVDQFPTILAAAYTAYLIYGAGITPALIAAFTWKRATKEGAVASLLSGAGVTLLWTFYLSSQPYFADWHPFLQQVTYPAVAASVLALVVVSFLTPAPPPEKWKPFFQD